VMICACLGERFSCSEKICACLGERFSCLEMICACLGERFSPSVEGMEITRSLIQVRQYSFFEMNPELRKDDVPSEYRLVPFLQDVLQGQENQRTQKEAAAAVLIDFEVEDEIEIQRDEMIKDFEGRMQKKVIETSLFLLV
jgi:hypothetical protein